MKARGKREARRPWYAATNAGPALKGRNNPMYFGPSGLNLL
jgi:hypothetical protein